MRYIDIHYKIDSGYMWGSGMPAEKMQAFEAEIRELFTGAGWTIGRDWAGASLEARSGKSRLYLHPMDISGELAVELIAPVYELLDKAKTFSIIEVLKLDELVDLSDEEYLVQLESKKVEIEGALLSAFSTRRKNQFVSVPQVVEQVKERYHIQRLTSHIGRSSLDVEWKFVERIVAELREKGWLETHPERNYYCRSIKG